MVTLFTLLMHLLSLYIFLILANVIFSWLYAFNIINAQNSLVRAIGEFLYTVCEPPARIVRKFVPNLGTIDISPAIVLIIVWVIQNLLIEYVAPLILRM